MSDPVRIERNWWVYGLHQAEQLYKLGFYYDGVDDIGAHIFRHPCGGQQGFHYGEEWQYKKGMLDYVEHHNNNPEIYKGDV